MQAAVGLVTPHQTCMRCLFLRALPRGSWRFQRRGLIYPLEATCLLARFVINNLSKLSIMSQRTRSGHSSRRFPTHGRGRGARGGGRGGGYTWPKDPVSLATLPPPRGELIESSTLESLLSATDFRITQPAIQSCKYLTSFSWLQNKAPTVVVPGKLCLSYCRRYETF